MKVILNIVIIYLTMSRNITDWSDDELKVKLADMLCRKAIAKRRYDENNSQTNLLSFEESSYLFEFYKNEFERRNLGESSIVHDSSISTSTESSTTHTVSLDDTSRGDENFCPREDKDSYNWTGWEFKNGDKGKGYYRIIGYQSPLSSLFL